MGATHSIRFRMTLAEISHAAIIIATLSTPLSLAKAQGEIESQIALRALALDAAKGDELWISRARAGVSAWLGDALVELAIDTSLQNGSLLPPLGQPRSVLRTLNMLEESQPFESVGLRTRAELERLSLTLYSPSGASITIGRQAIGHGNARVFAVTDIIAPNGVFELDTEFKTGVDAVRLTVPFGERAEVEGLVVAHRDNASDAVYILRARASLPSHVDLAVFGGYTYGDLTIAGSAAGDWGGAGWYAEGILRGPCFCERELRGTIGIAYKVAPLDLGITGEVYLNGRTAFYQPGNEHGNSGVRGALSGLDDYLYAALILDWQPHPLVRAALLILHNDELSETHFWPTMEWSVTNDMALGAGLLFRYSEAPGVMQRPGVYGDLRAWF